MASDNQAEIDRLRDRIREMLKRAPDSIVNNSGVERVRSYKKSVTEAQKQLQSSRPTLAGVSAAHNGLQSYY